MPKIQLNLIRYNQIENTAFLKTFNTLIMNLGKELYIICGSNDMIYVKI